MNSKFLYAATVAVSLISTLAMADEAPVSRSQVQAELHQAIVDGTLRRTEFDIQEPVRQAAVSTTSREQVAIELAQARQARKALVGPLANRTYNPYGTGVLQTSTLARADVKADVRAAQADGTLQRRTDYDDAVSPARRAVVPHAASPTLAQRLKARLSAAQS